MEIQFNQHPLTYSLHYNACSTVRKFIETDAAPAVQGGFHFVEFEHPLPAQTGLAGGAKGELMNVVNAGK